MKTIEWKIILTDDNRLASLENVTNLPLDKIESQLIIVGMLENLKVRHLEKLGTLFEKTEKTRKGDRKDTFEIK